MKASRHCAALHEAADWIDKALEKLDATLRHIQAAATDAGV